MGVVRRIDRRSDRNRYSQRGIEGDRFPAATAASDCLPGCIACSRCPHVAPNDVGDALLDIGALFYSDEIARQPGDFFGVIKQAIAVVLSEQSDNLFP
jgi:hypothetical protein